MPLTFARAVFDDVEDDRPVSRRTFSDAAPHGPPILPADRAVAALAVRVLGRVSRTILGRASRADIVAVVGAAVVRP